MTPEQSFRDRGVVVLRGALSRSHVAPIARHVLAELKRLRIWAGGKPLSKRLDGVPAFQQVTKLAELVKYAALPERIAPPSVLSLMAQLADGPLVAARDAQLLLSLPNQGTWSMSGLNWHVDLASATGRLTGIQIFLLLDDVAPHGGATLALAGSQRLTDKRARAEVRSWLDGADDLDKKLTRAGLSIVEMSGNAGDVYLMDMRVLHTPSINASPRPRLMATSRYLTT